MHKIELLKKKKSETMKKMKNDKKTSLRLKKYINK